MKEEPKATWIVTAGKPYGVCDPALTRYFHYSRPDLESDRLSGPFIFEDLEGQAARYVSEMINSTETSWANLIFRWI